MCSNSKKTQSCEQFWIEVKALTNIELLSELRLQGKRFREVVHKEKVYSELMVEQKKTDFIRNFTANLRVASTRKCQFYY